MPRWWPGTRGEAAGAAARVSRSASSAACSRRRPRATATRSEVSCKCLWILMATQNSVKQDDPNNFGDTHPATVPSSRRASSIAQFNRLSNAHKLAYVEMVPGWEVLSKLLASQRRNAIDHGTARHDLLSGRVSSDKDPQGVTYLRFLEETFGVFEALAILMQVLRAVRIATSPDFRPA